MAGDENVAGTGGRECVQLNWNVVWQNREFPEDNYNVILHEFAHVLDQADDDEAQSIPVPEGTEKSKAWQALLDREFPRLVEAYESGQGHVIDKYGTTVRDDRRPEFFTCATEAFFERSQQLRNECPEIYKALKDYYRLDPAEWRQAV